MKPLSVPRFLADCHLGRLARQLRFAGFDTLYFRSMDDTTLLKIARRDKRILLTRDRELLRRGGALVLPIRSIHLVEQLHELAFALELEPFFRPFTRCMVCNASLRKVSPETIRSRVPERVFLHFHDFRECPDCGRIYWKGDHYRKMIQRWKQVFEWADREREET